MQNLSVREQLEKLYSEEKAQFYWKFFRQFETDHALVIPFESAEYRAPDENESADLIFDNNEFPILLCLPASYPDTPISDLVVMINGFNEQRPVLRVYGNKKYGLCSLFGSRDKGAASVLMPIPFHYWRKPNDEHFRHRTPSVLVYESKVRFYLGYRQVLKDVDRLVDLVHTGAGDFSRYFGASTAIHLYGFSLGGLGVLSSYIKNEMENGNRFLSCTLLMSGGNLESFSFRLTGLTDDEIVEIKDFYYSSSLDSIVASTLHWEITEEEDRLYKIFQERVLGPKVTGDWDKLSESKFAHYIESCAGNVLFEVGGQDNIMRPEAVINAFPAGIGQKIYLLDGVSHELWKDNAWKNDGGAEEAVNVAWSHMQDCKRAGSDPTLT